MVQRRIRKRKKPMTTRKELKSRLMTTRKEMKSRLMTTRKARAVKSTANMAKSTANMAKSMANMAKSMANMAKSMASITVANITESSMANTMKDASATIRASALPKSTSTCTTTLEAVAPRIV